MFEALFSNGEKVAIILPLPEAPTEKIMLTSEQS